MFGTTSSGNILILLRFQDKSCTFRTKWFQIFSYSWYWEFFYVFLIRNDCFLARYRCYRWRSMEESIKTNRMEKMLITKFMYCKTVERVVLQVIWSEQCENLEIRSNFKEGRILTINSPSIETTGLSFESKRASWNNWKERDTPTWSYQESLHSLSRTTLERII